MAYSLFALTRLSPLHNTHTASHNHLTPLRTPAFYQQPPWGTCYYWKRPKRTNSLLAMHPRVLYETREAIAYPLFLIYNKTLQSGKLPSDWKLAEVTASIYKKGPKSDTGNYRPVSLTSVCCKIFESFSGTMLWIIYWKIIFLVQNSMVLLKGDLRCSSFYKWWINGQNV